ncbi:MAG: riboflavin synthase [Gemmatimonadetes bacterium]|nr:riboflavin synthase [Gemmatimonadota bacterium]
MFTGLITDVGTIDRVASTAAGREFRIRTAFTGLVEGESIAVNGACLTVRDFGDGWFSVAAVTTTLGRTTMGAWSAGRRVNLERALALGERLGGHLVQGHVDGVGTVRAVRTEGDARLVDVAVPEAIAALLVPLGAITVDGVSLTVNALPAPRVVQLSLIEFTLRHTTLGELAVGSEVHLEGDLIGKYVQRLAAPHFAQADASRSRMTLT